MAVEYCVVAPRMVSRGADVVVDSGGSDQRSWSGFLASAGSDLPPPPVPTSSVSLPTPSIPAFAPAGTVRICRSSELADGRLIGQAEFDDFDVGFIDGAATKLSKTSSLGEQFVYEFDFGDCFGPICARWGPYGSTRNRS